jgi:hypothetical protein
MDGTAVWLRMRLAKCFRTYPQNVQNLRNYWPADGRPIRAIGLAARPFNAAIPGLLR